MQTELTIQKLNKSESLWLSCTYTAFKADKQISARDIWNKLQGQIPANFHPASIDIELINASGENITILGIIALEKSKAILSKIDTLIFAIRKFLLEQPNAKTVDLTAIANNINFDPEEAGRLMNLISRYGSFYRSASINENGITFKSIDLGDLQNHFYQYLHFEGSEKLILNYLEQKKINEERTINNSTNVQNSQAAPLQFSPIFRSRVDRVNTGICFVLMPFTQDWSNRIYKVIKDSVEALGLQCLRADNLSGPIVIEDIWTQINQAGIIIADVTGKNPNVMYELGIAHTIGKPVILLTQELNNIPFDFTHLRHHEYLDNIDGGTNLNSKLRKLVKDIYQANYPEQKNG